MTEPTQVRVSVELLDDDGSLVKKAVWDKVDEFHIDQRVLPSSQSNVTLQFKMDYHDAGVVGSDLPGSTLVRILRGFDVSSLDGGKVRIQHFSSGYECVIDADRALTAQYEILDKIASQNALARKVSSYPEGV